MTQVVDVPGLGSVEFPDGMAHADMEKAIQRSLTSKAGAMALEGTGPLERGAIGAGKAVSDLWQGAQQLLGRQNSGDVQETRDRDAALMKTNAGQVGNFAGNVAMAVPTMMVPGLNTFTGAAALGGAMGALQPTVDGESRGTNTALGAGGGLLGQGAGGLLGRAIRPVQSQLSGEEARLAAEAARRGVPLSAGQATGSRPMQIAESVMENLPFTSGPQLAQRQAQQTAFNRAVGSTFGAQADSLTPDVMGAARSRIGRQFTDLASRNTLQADNALMTGLAQIDDNARRYLTPDVGRVVLNRIDDVMARIDNGTMTGTAYRNLDSELGRAARGTANGDLRNALGELRRTLREAMDRSISQADQAEWQGARRQYANLMTVAPLAARNETGDVSGRTLLSAANAGNRNARFGAPSELADLGRIGRAFVAEQIPNSGTAQRAIMQSLLTGGGAGVGAVGAAMGGGDPVKGALAGGSTMGAGLLLPRAVQMLMNSPAGQAYLKRGLLSLSPEELAGINALARPAGAAGLLGYTQQQ
jgi:hypothetical protein